MQSACGILTNQVISQQQDTESGHPLLEVVPIKESNTPKPLVLSTFPLHRCSTEAPAVSVLPTKESLELTVKLPPLRPIPIVKPSLAIKFELVAFQAVELWVAGRELIRWFHSPELRPPPPPPPSLPPSSPRCQKRVHYTHHQPPPGPLPVSGPPHHPGSLQ